MRRDTNAVLKKDNWMELRSLRGSEEAAAEAAQLSTAKQQQPLKPSYKSFLWTSNVIVWRRLNFSTHALEKSTHVREKSYLSRFFSACTLKNPNVVIGWRLMFTKSSCNLVQAKEVWSRGGQAGRQADFSRHATQPAALGEQCWVDGRTDRRSRHGKSSQHGMSGL